MVKEKLKEFFSSEELSTKLLECQTSSEVKQLFAENGMDITDEEIKILKDYVDKFVENGGELSAKELDEISGGWTLAGAISTPVSVFTEVLVGLAYSPIEGWKKAVVNHHNRMHELETSDKSKQTLPKIQTRPFFVAEFK